MWIEDSREITVPRAIPITFLSAFDWSSLRRVLRVCGYILDLSSESGRDVLFLEISKIVSL